MLDGMLLRIIYTNSSPWLHNSSIYSFCILSFPGLTWRHFFIYNVAACSWTSLPRWGEAYRIGKVSYMAIAR